MRRAGQYTRSISKAIRVTIDLQKKRINHKNTQNRWVVVAHSFIFILGARALLWFYVCALCTWLVPAESRRGVGCPRTGLTESCELPGGTGNWAASTPSFRAAISLASQKPSFKCEVRTCITWITGRGFGLVLFLLCINLLQSSKS